MTGLADIDALVTHHRDASRSGVARFNAVLAERLGVPLLGVAEALDAPGVASPLLSFKFGQLDDDAAAQVAEVAGKSRFQLFLHDFASLPLEVELTARADLVWCGNSEVLERAREHNPAVVGVWAPSLLEDLRPFKPVDLTVFSFGMAHKVRTEMFERLKALLDASGRSYVIYSSHANHETATLSETKIVHDEMERIFGDDLYFLGNLSDVAVFNNLVRANFFAAFFPSGVRANNTTIASAMEHGAVVVTNLDEHSPDYLVHLENVIDVERCEELPSDPLVLRRIGANAMETARRHGWDELVQTMRNATFENADGSSFPGVPA